jgi:hypothetical protein
MGACGEACSVWGAESEVGLVEELFGAGAREAALGQVRGGVGQEGPRLLDVVLQQQRLAQAQQEHGPVRLTNALRSLLQSLQTGFHILFRTVHAGWIR